MINLVYLILVMYSNNGVSVEKIPQANMAQCQVNAKNLAGLEFKGVGGGMVMTKTRCVVGVK